MSIFVKGPSAPGIQRANSFCGLSSKDTLSPEFVNDEGLSVDLSFVSAAMAIWAKSNQVVRGIVLAGFPRNYVVHIDFDAPTMGNSTPMSGFY